MNVLENDEISPVSHENDVRGNPAWESRGKGQESFDVRAFDTQGRVLALGNAASGAPPRCGVTAVGTPPSPLCDAFSLDRLGRVTDLSESPSGSATDRVHSLLNYDAHGNLASIRTGCADGSSCTQPELSWQHDDFGHVIEVREPNTREAATGTSPGVTRYEYTAQGAVERKQTPAMRPGAVTLEWTFDALGRELSLGSSSGGAPGTPGGPVQLYRNTWDTDSALPTSCLGYAKALTNTQGRLASSINPVWKSWYGYDESGRLTVELKVKARDGKAEDCDPGNGGLGLATTWRYTAGGDVESITYPHGRTVEYKRRFDGRVQSISATTFVGPGLAKDSVLLLSNARWEPFGGLRSYEVSGSAGDGRVEYHQGDASKPADCAVSPALDADGTGRLRAISVSRAAFQEPVFTRAYQWNGDNLIAADTCYLGHSALHEAFDYDNRGQLVAATTQPPDVAYSPRTYTYDARMNRTRTASGKGLEHGHEEVYGLAQPDLLLAQTPVPPGIPAQHLYSYDDDGNVRRKQAADDSSGATAHTWDFDWGEASGSGNVHALETVMRAVAINASSNATTTTAAWFNYFYDGQRQRLLKVDPVGAETAFFWDASHHLLEDVGPVDFNTGTRPMDEYVWLDGRPVVVFRGAVDAREELHLADDSKAECSRDGDELPCQRFFLVTDNVLRPVLALDSALAITGTGEYEPFGHPNRVTRFLQPPSGSAWPAIPLPAGLSAQALFGLEMQVRAHFAILDSEDVTDKGGRRDFAYLGGDDRIPYDSRSYSGFHRGDVWTDWAPVAASKTGSVAPFLWWVAADDENCWPMPGCANNNFPYLGFVADAFEYRRVEPGVRPWFPPLRAAGQYWDAETDLFENWNRYLEAGSGRYLSIEPMLQDPLRARAEITGTRPLSAYAYASNNPASATDPDGRLTRQYRRDGEGNELVRALEAPLRKHLIDDCRKKAEENESDCLRQSRECNPPAPSGTGMGDLKELEERIERGIRTCVKGANCEYEACLAGATSAGGTDDYRAAYFRCMRRP